MFRAFCSLLMLLALAFAQFSAAHAQEGGKQKKAPEALAVQPTLQPDRLGLALSAVIGSETQVIQSGLIWRIFKAEGEEISPTPVQTTEAAAPTLGLAPGNYVIHVAYGLASATRRIKLDGKSRSERLSVPAGGLKVRGELNGTIVNPAKLSVRVFIPSETNSEEKLVAGELKSGTVLRLPEGTYHVVSTYGGTNASVRADVTVKTGKVVDVLMRHRAARVTLKLVSKTGGEALPNTEWSILTPGGDIIHEDTGAFVTMILADGTYNVIARRDGKTFLDEFQVATGPDREIEVFATTPQATAQ
jgi:hypothetical protein